MPRPAPDLAPTAPPPSGPSRAVVVASLALFAVLALLSSRGRDLWGDEPEAGLVLRQLTTPDARLLDALAPSISGVPVLETPPLVPLLAAACARTVGGVVGDTLAARIPSVLFAVLGLVTTLWLGRTLWDGRVAFLAMTIQATTAFYFLQASWLGSEFAFVVACQLGLTGLALADHAMQARRPHRLPALAGWIGLGLASLTGHAGVALVLVLVPFGMHLFFGRGLTGLARGLGSATGGLAWLAFPALGAPWHVWAATNHRELWWNDHVLGWPISPPEAPGYLLTLVLGFLPWIIAAFLGVYHGKDRLGRYGERLMMMWIIGTLLLLTVSPLERVVLTLLVWPPLALLIPAAIYETRERFSVWEDLLRGAVGRALPWLLRAPLAITVILAVVWLSGVYEGFVNASIRALLDDSSRMYRLLGLATIGAVGSLFVARRVETLVKDRNLAAGAFETARAILFLLFLSGFFLPILDPVASPGDFLRRVGEHVGAAPLASYGRERFAAIEYYIHRDVERLAPLVPLAEPGQPDYAPREALTAWIARDTTAFLLTTESERDEIRWAAQSLDDRLHETGITGQFGRGERYFLLSNRGPATSAEGSGPEG